MPLRLLPLLLNQSLHHRLIQKMNPQKLTSRTAQYHRALPQPTIECPTSHTTPMSSSSPPHTMLPRSRPSHNIPPPRAHPAPYRHYTQMGARQCQPFEKAHIVSVQTLPRLLLPKVWHEPNLVEGLRLTRPECPSATIPIATARITRPKYRPTVQR